MRRLKVIRLLYSLYDVHMSKKKAHLLPTMEILKSL